MRPTVVIDVVGLTADLLGESTPNLLALARAGAVRSIDTVLPAVTCTVQSTFTTGTLPRGHGCVGNGWYCRETAEVALWRQSNRLVTGEKMWEVGRRRAPELSCAKLFWWFNMYSSADVSVTPRPIYRADGLKLPDIYTEPSSLRDELVERLGPFPLFNFWGPAADIRSSEWIARCARHVFDTRRCTLTLVYLPHLDYDLQRFGPGDARIADALRRIDAVCGELVEHVVRQGARVIVLSEYGITGVSDAVHVNRELRRAGLLRVRCEQGLDKLDAGASEAFAVADHQVAHIYVHRPERVAEVAALVQGLDGVEAVLDAQGKRAVGLDHPRAGDLVAIARRDRWFSYYYWLDDARSPEFARTVDIHRKPGYDPVELFVDPGLVAPRLKLAWILLKKACGFRYLVDVIPLDATLVRGSHGRLPDRPGDKPLLISSEPELLPDGDVHATEVRDLVLDHVLAEPARPRIRAPAQPVPPGWIAT